MAISETYQTPFQFLSDLVSDAVLENLEGGTRTRAIIDEIENSKWRNSKPLSGTVLFGAIFKRGLNFLSVNPTIFLIIRIIYLFPDPHFYIESEGPIYIY